MAKDAKLQKLVESKIKPAFDNFNLAMQKTSLAFSDLAFELDEEKRERANKIVSTKLNEIKESN